MKTLMLATALLFGSAAQAEVRAVFVGIDKYAYGAVQPPALRFADLSGAVGDTRRIRDALARSHRLAVGTMPEGETCQTQGPAALTLINACATKAAILAAWQQQLDASKAGDTLLLYFAGHGSRFINEDGSQASGFNSTLMPHDARRPQATAVTDILDAETRNFINLATSWGVNVVTWFDSCNSGTATRQRVLVGLVSTGVGCGRKGVPALYTNVAHYADWIEAVQQEVKTSGVTRCVVAQSGPRKLSCSAKLNQPRTSRG